MIVAVLGALIAGALFATGGVLQQREAATRPKDESLSVLLIVDLARQPLWLAGMAVAVLSYAFQALALAFGPLAVVQPLIITELIFAVPVSARLQHATLGLREWVGVLAVSGGLAVAIVAADPRGGDPLPGVSHWLYVLPAAAVLSVLAVVVGRLTTGTARAALFALAAAVTLGTQAALLQSTTEVFRGGVWHGLSSWEPYVMAVFAIGGLLLVQSAYQAGPLAASLPIIDAIEPTVAVVIAVAVFGEHIRTGALTGALSLLGIVLVLLGIAILDTSPLVAKLLATQEQKAPPSRPAAASDPLEVN